MEFKDYYAILCIGRQSSQDEIKAAYRTMSKKWHPDLNPGRDVTQMMQDINEAYAILKDEVKRRRYDVEYDRIHHAMSASQSENRHQMYDDYEVHDETLKHDMNEARKYAEDLVSEFFKSLKETSQIAVKGAWDEAKGYLIGGLIMSIIGFLLLFTCSNL